MAKIKLTDAYALKAEGPADGKAQRIYYDTVSPLALRVTKGGARTWCVEVWIRATVAGGKGKQERRSLASINALSCAEARKLAAKVSGELLQGHDRLSEAREEKAKEKREAFTLADAVAQYVKGKRRAKDGLPLKARTVTDYQAMVNDGGLLHTLADKSIYQISADDMRTVYESILERSQRQAVYAMQVLRACMNWHGVQIENSPLSKATAGKERIVLPGTAGDPKPIPPEKLADWWREATKLDGNTAADALRFMLLTGCRPGEVLGSKLGEVLVSPGLLAGHVDLDGGRVTLLDTKNRTSHTIYLSAQALDILRPHVEGKNADAKVFDVWDSRKALDAITKAAAISQRITPHKLRHTFASVAEELVSGYALKRMLNHTSNGDVTGAHYIGKSETQLRAGWQAVADFIAGPSGNVVSLQKVA